MKIEKQYLLDEIKGQISGATAFVFTQYGKLSANRANEFRRTLQKHGGHFEVVKKRVLVKALEQAGHAIAVDDLTGHIGIVVATTDPLELTKAVLKFSEANESVLTAVGGYFEGILVGAADVARIATLPSRDQMRAELLGLMEAPMSQTLAVIEALLSSVPHCIQNKSQQESGQQESQS